MQAKIDELIETIRRAPPSTGFRRIDNTGDYAVSFDDLKLLADEYERMREALEHVFELGHNLDCIFCGFKDKAALDALKA